MTVVVFPGSPSTYLRIYAADKFWLDGAVASRLCLVDGIQVEPMRFFYPLPSTEIFRVLPWMMAFTDLLKFPRITVDDGSYFYITIVVTEAKKFFY